MTTVKQRDVPSFRVFVIELDDGVGPRLDEELAWVYVGETTREPQERFEQHLRGARNGNGRLYSADVRDHGVRLRPDLYEHLAPLFAAADAKRAERSLADRLAARGYSVKGGH